MTVERESMEYDVAVVGGGPAGLATAIRLKQLAAERGRPVTVCLVEKGAEIGAHTLSGAVIETRALDELFPDASSLGAPLDTPVERDEFHLLTGPESSLRVPGFLVPKSMHNGGNCIVSLGRLCRWLGEQAEALDVDVFPGFAATTAIFESNGAVAGVVTVDRGRSSTGAHKASFEPGVELRARQTVLAEGARGHLGRQMIERFSLDEGREPQHYGLGLKELWEIPDSGHRRGLVVHGAGWPLTRETTGGFFAYHADGNRVTLGLIVDLNYTNPWLNPYAELQRLKHHPLFARMLKGGRRIGYGARAITKGGSSALPKMSMPGALIVGCDAGTLDFAKIKGTHMAMKSGMVAAETIFAALDSGTAQRADLTAYGQALDRSWVGADLRAARNFGAALHRFGIYAGGAFNFVDQTLFGGRLPLTLGDRRPDHETLRKASEAERIAYPQPDGELSFDLLSSVYLSGTNHSEDQPCHLQLRDADLPITHNLAEYDAPEQRYCPAGVYEIVEEQGSPRLQINAQNCLHCKTCDIKDPLQNIVWVPPEDGGPAYIDM